MNYYVMECEGLPPVRTIEICPDLPGGPWMTGHSISIPINGPLKYTFDPKSRGNAKAMYDGAIPLMRNDLASALKSAGVDNIEFFDAIIEDPSNCRTSSDYRAFNILGLVAAADMNMSQFMSDQVDEEDLVTVNFSALFIDSSKIPSELLVFRLAQSVNAIVVHEMVRNAIESAGIAGMYFYDNGEWAG